SVEIAKILLDAGAEPDSLAGMYGGKCTTMSMLVSSCHPAEAGVQVPLVHLLIDYGAAVDEKGSGSWTSPLMTALIFGYQDAAQPWKPFLLRLVSAGSKMSHNCFLMPTATPATVRWRLRRSLDRPKSYGCCWMRAKIPTGTIPAACTLTEHHCTTRQ